MAFWFRRLRMDNASVENIRKAHSNGPVVYVMYTKSRLDWIAFNQDFESAPAASGSVYRRFKCHLGSAAS